MTIKTMQDIETVAVGICEQAQLIGIDSAIGEAATTNDSNGFAIDVRYRDSAYVSRTDYTRVEGLCFKPDAWAHVAALARYLFTDPQRGIAPLWRPDILSQWAPTGSRNITFRLMLTASERERLNTMAEGEGVTPSQLIRDKVFRV